MLLLIIVSSLEVDKSSGIDEFNLAVEETEETVNYTNSSNDNMKEENKKLSVIDELRNKYNNDDVVGVLEVLSSNHKFPIMQTSDNDYYLEHTPDKEKNAMGSVFLDFRVNINNGKKLLIYGHSSNRTVYPFNFLQNYHDREYYDNHKYIEITTGSGIKKYEVFSVFVETEDFSYMETDFVSDDEYLSHIESLKKKSIYDDDVKLSSDDEILILQTCSTHRDYKNYENKYLLIVSRRV